MNKIEELRYLIKGVDKEGEATYKKMLSILDITPGQNEILKILSIKNKLTIAELGELLICGADSPSRVVQRLVNKELVRKITSKEDARKVLLEITNKGKSILKQSSKIEQDFNQNILLNLQGQIDIENLIEILTRQIEGTKSLTQLNERKKMTEIDG